MMLLSIVVPVWNRQTEITRCLDSVVNIFHEQIATKKVEIIVSDNASDDETLLSIQTWQEKTETDATILTSESNCGPLNNWVRALSAAKGKYTILLFSDDYLQASNSELIIDTINSMSLENINVGRLSIRMEDSDGVQSENSNLSLSFDDLNSVCIDESTFGYIENHLDTARARNRKESSTFSPVSPTGYVLNRELMLEALRRWRNFGRFLENGAGIDQLSILYPALRSKKIRRIKSLTAVMVASETSITRLSQRSAFDRTLLAADYSYSAVLLLPYIFQRFKRRSFYISYLIVARFVFHKVKLFLLGLFKPD